MLNRYYNGCGLKNWSVVVKKEPPKHASPPPDQPTSISCRYMLHWIPNSLKTIWWKRKWYQKAKGFVPHSNEWACQKPKHCNIRWAIQCIELLLIYYPPLTLSIVLEFVVILLDNWLTMLHIAVSKIEFGQSISMIFVSLIFFVGYTHFYVWDVGV